MSGCSGGTSLLAVKERASQTLCSVWKAAASMESLNRNLEHLRFGGGDIEDEDQLLESLNGILQALAEDKHRTSSLLSESEVLPAFARYLQSSPHCGVKAAQVLAEIAKNEEMKTPCIDAGLVPILIPLLDSTDQEMLLHVGRAIGRICYDNNELQEQLVAAEVIRSLVRIMLDYPDNEPLVRVNLLALSNLADLDTAKDALSKTRIAEHLVHQLRKANHHEKVEIILEVLQTLAENDVLKLQLAEAGIQDAVAELLLRLQDSSQPEDMCSLKAASDLIVSLLLGADAAQELGQDPMLLSRLVQWCDSKDHAGVCGEANRLLASLLRHSQSQEVVKAIQDAQGVKHLVSMATSEHVIMQNEALIALAIASAINLEIIKAAFKEAKLVQNIHKLLQDESTGPEVKYNSIGLLCSLFNSGDLRQEAEEDKVKETLEKLCGHINGNVAKQALMALQILNEEHSIFEQ
ncbi:rap1 GTPase-GDP dissociation stimulator 1-A-like isoform X11 [Hemicordylus capensis]|uniref:rap1 GTPase-GDP dissociation stimulator 1-A-like isoform X11 n=1 Tax=Hemicordylus capensis TaxID=884348 RepID=UPI0023024837|nr:rap1 GTPase-GDP dissociation stimulator 1-A-like isoform X11 [Hemicordylus capensis]